MKTTDVTRINYVNEMIADYQRGVEAMQEQGWKRT